MTGSSAVGAAIPPFFPDAVDTTHTLPRFLDALGGLIDVQTANVDHFWLVVAWRSGTGLLQHCLENLTFVHIQPNEQSQKSWLNDILVGKTLLVDLALRTRGTPAGTRQCSNLRFSILGITDNKKTLKSLPYPLKTWNTLTHAVCALVKSRHLFQCATHIEPPTIGATSIMCARHTRQTSVLTGKETQLETEQNVGDSPHTPPRTHSSKECTPVQTFMRCFPSATTKHLSQYLSLHPPRIGKQTFQAADGRRGQRSSHWPRESDQLGRHSPLESTER